MVILKRKDPEYKNIEMFANKLPKNYNFELQKTLNIIMKYKCKNIALQFPDGLLKFSTIITDCIKYYTGANVIILAEVVYGACNIDDRSAFDLGADLLIHYGHSCLVPVTITKVKCIYIFVSIIFDTTHLCDMIRKVAIDEMKEKSTFEKGQDKLYSYDLHLSDFISQNFLILGTIQFNTAVHSVSQQLNISTSQIKPLSPGEVLGCTSPKVSKDIVVFISDGRFHLESVMIQNPGKKFYKYCPFSKVMSVESYDLAKMLTIRQTEKNKALNAKYFGIVISMLGRQGNSKIYKNVIKRIACNYQTYKIALKEINNTTLSSYKFVDAFVQIGCPRLSIDWGHGFDKPILNPFEVFNRIENYKMDYYSKEETNEWNNYTN